MSCAGIRQWSSSTTPRFTTSGGPGDCLGRLVAWACVVRHGLPRTPARLTTNGVGRAAWVCRGSLGGLGGAAVWFDTAFRRLQPGSPRTGWGGRRGCAEDRSGGWVVRLCGSTRPSADSSPAHHERGPEARVRGGSLGRVGCWGGGSTRAGGYTGPAHHERLLPLDWVRMSVLVYCGLRFGGLGVGGGASLGR